MFSRVYKLKFNLTKLYVIFPVNVTSYLAYKFFCSGQTIKH
jgi:hypothetical protein